MTTERLRDWDLRELIERLDRAYDGVGLLLVDELPDKLCGPGEDILSTLDAAVRYFEQLRYARRTS